VAVIVCGLVPTFEGVTEAVQAAAFPPLGARVHVPKVSPASDELSVTVPVGLVCVPASVSVTVTVALLAWPTTTVLSDKLTLVVVARLLTVCATPMDVLVRKFASPTKVAVSVLVPDVVGFNWHVPVVTVPTQESPVPSFTVTLSVPAMVPLPGAFTVTVKFTVMGWPMTEGFGVCVVIVVVVPAALITPVALAMKA
jgi:hypothetical protein